MFILVIICWLTERIKSHPSQTAVYCTMYDVHFLFLWLWRCYCHVLLSTQRFVVQRLHFLGWHHHSRKWTMVCGRLCDNRAQHQRSRIAPNVINGTVTDNQEDTQTRLPNPQQREHNSHENKRTVLFFSFFYSGRAAPALLPASRAESCLYRAFPTATATTTHAPSAWLALSHHGTPKPTATGHKQARPTHRHTYPNTRLPTINHYSGGLGGCF